MSLGVLIFSGYNQRAVIAFCRYAVERAIAFAIITKDKSDPIFKTQYSSFIVASKSKKDLEIEGIVNYGKLAKKKLHVNQILILPTSEYLNRFLLDNVDRLSNENILTGLAKKDVYKKVSDKYSFSQLCGQNDLKTPKEVPFEEKFYPLVAKPKTFVGANDLIYKPVIIWNNCEKEKYFQNKNVEDFYFQKFINGKSIYLLYYINENDYSVYSQENFVQEPQGGSMILSKSANYHCDKIAGKYANLLIKIGFKGLVMIELKLSEGEYYMIEANPRLWGPIQLILDSGMSLLDDFAFDNKLTESKPQLEYQEGIWYFWEGGATKNHDNLSLLSYYNYNYKQFISKIKKFRKIEIYNRHDTRNIFLVENKFKELEELGRLYNKQSKHSNYQNIPKPVAKLLSLDGLVINSRYETERMNFFKEHILFEGSKILDIGGNTGFFSFESLYAGASEVIYYEGNYEHSKFVSLASKILNSNIQVRNEYIDFNEPIKDEFDIIFLLNVIHHLGDDFGNKEVSMEQAKIKMKESINFFRHNTCYLILQMGFCWQGNTSKQLFLNGTKNEMIDFVKDAIEEKWEIMNIGIAEMKHNKVKYQNANEKNLFRQDKLGEFLNRPIFILKSKFNSNV